MRQGNWNCVRCAGILQQLSKLPATGRGYSEEASSPSPCATVSLLTATEGVDSGGMVFRAVSSGDWLLKQSWERERVIRSHQRITYISTKDRQEYTILHNACLCTVTYYKGPESCKRFQDRYWIISLLYFRYWYTHIFILITALRHNAVGVVAQ